MFTFATLETPLTPALLMFILMWVTGAKWFESRTNFKLFRVLENFVATLLPSAFPTVMYILKSKRLPGSLTFSLK